MKVQVPAIKSQAGLVEMVRRPEGIWVEYSLLSTNWMRGIVSSVLYSLSYLVLGMIQRGRLYHSHVLDEETGIETVNNPKLVESRVRI